MKRCFLFLIFLLFLLNANAQIILDPAGESGSGYPSITQSGLDIESPDCVHESFGPHVTQTMDDVLDRNVFEFHSHIDDDNDRCQVFDRVRMEIKGGPGTDERSQHVLGEESWYRWKFKLPSDFQGSSSFCHIFQNKIKGGEDSGFPVITITPRTSKLEIIHNGGDTGADLGKLVTVDLEPFLGNWIEAYVYQLHAEDGKFEIILKDLKTGVELVNYKNDNIDLWRDGGEYSRPKWGIYRSKNENLKDEIVRFANFCISETAEAQCPADDIVFLDEEAPSPPQNLTVDQFTINTVSLSWEASSDNFGVSEYVVYQGANEIKRGNFLETTLEGLEGGTDYSFSITAIDAAGNESVMSDIVNITTDPADALPVQPSQPFPADMSMVVSNKILLRWTNGKNADSSLVFFGEAEELQLISTQVDNEYEIELEPDSTYYWQIGQKNENGITLGPVWTFTTGSADGEGPWLVYRGNQRLDLENEFLEPRDIPDEPEIDEVSEDPFVPNNNIYQYFEDSDDKFRWRYTIAETDTAFTVVARIKAFEEAKNIGYFEVRLGGVRDKLRINHSSLKLEKSSPVIEEDYDFDWDSDFHIIRVTMEKAVMKVYLDEEAIPFMTGFSETDDGGTNFEFGKSGGTSTGSFVDWMTILPNQAVGPDEGPSLPQDLILSNNAEIAELTLDGVGLDGFHPDSFDYVIPLGDELLIPEINVITASDLARVEMDTVISESLTSITIEVTAQDGFTQKNYKLNFIATSAISDLDLDQEISIYPNPSPQSFTITIPENSKSIISLYNLNGQRVLSQTGIGNVTIDRKIASGSYIVGIYLGEGKRIFRKLIIK